MNNLLIILLIVILFSIWNGLVIRWYLTKDQKYSTYWHRVGFVVRALLPILLYPDWGFILIYLNLSWTVYDMIINTINGWNLLYVGGTSEIDIFLKRFHIPLKIALLIITIVYFVILN